MTSGGFTVDPATGGVTGSLAVEDPASSSFRVKFPGPRHGLVSFGGDGTYTYTPTHAGRLRAGFTAGADTDSFFIQVSGEHGTSLIDITVPVAPARIVVTDPIATPGYGFLALSSDASRLYVTQMYYGTLAIVRTADHSVQTVNVPTHPGALVVSPDGQRLYIAHPSSDTITVHDTAGKTVRTDSVGDWPQGLALSHDGTKLYAAINGPGAVIVYDTASGQSETILAVERPWTLALSPDGTRLYVAAGEGDGLGIIDLQDNSVVWVDVGPVWPHSELAVNSDGSRVYIPNGFAQKTLTAVNTADNSMKKVRVDEDPSGAVVSPDDSLLYAVSLQGDSIAVIDAWTLRVIEYVPVGATQLHRLVMTPDGTRVYAACGDPSNGVVAIDFVGINP